MPMKTGNIILLSQIALVVIATTLLLISLMALPKLASHPEISDLQRQTDHLANELESQLQQQISHLRLAAALLAQTSTEQDKAQQNALKQVEESLEWVRIGAILNGSGQILASSHELTPAREQELIRPEAVEALSQVGNGGIWISENHIDGALPTLLTYLRYQDSTGAARLLATSISLDFVTEIVNRAAAQFPAPLSILLRNGKGNRTIAATGAEAVTAESWKNIQATSEPTELEDNGTWLASVQLPGVGVNRGCSWLLLAQLPDSALAATPVQLTVSRIAMTAGVVLLFGLLLTPSLVRRALAPLSDLAAAMATLADAPMDAELQSPRGPQEVRNLLDSYNILVSRQQTRHRQAREAIKGAHRELEALHTSLRSCGQALRSELQQINAAVDSSASNALAHITPEAVKVVRKACVRLRHLASEIEELVEPEIGGRAKIQISFDSATVFDALMADLQVAASQQRLVLNYSPPPGDARLLQGDPEMIRRLMAGLVRHALLNLVTGGVTIRTEVVESESGQALLCFRVEAWGSCRDDAPIDKLFNPLRQQTGGLSAQIGTSNYELARAHQIASRLEAKLSIEGEPGVSDAVLVQVDLQGGGTKPIQSAPVELKGLRAAVLQDTVTEANQITAWLRSFGIDAQSIEPVDGLAMLESAVSNGKPYQIVITDQFMQGIEGDELAYIIRATPALGGPLMVMCSSTTRRGDGHKLAAAGYSIYLPKPVQSNELKAALELGIAQRGKTATPELITRHTLRERT
ncbi:MAG: hypothetical protein J4A00_02865 [Gammaproteobacteria bacterium]|nr:hypothetical protein [Gammaproteobacteria bacterium]